MGRTLVDSRRVAARQHITFMIRALFAHSAKRALCFRLPKANILHIITEACGKTALYTSGSMSPDVCASSAEQQENPLACDAAAADAQMYLHLHLPKPQRRCEITARIARSASATSAKQSTDKCSRCFSSAADWQRSVGFFCRRLA